MATARNDLAEAAAARGTFYGFLAGVFRAEPGSTLIQELQRSEFSEALSGLGLSFGEEFANADPVQLAEALALEYTRLFIGPGPRISPHESLHVDLGNASENGFWGPQTAAVKRFIEATGLTYDERFTGLPDHISAEFELMQKLAARESQSWGEGDKTDARWCRSVQKQFLDEHLTTWIPRFCEKVMALSAEPFYRKMAEVVRAFVDFDAANFEPVTGEPKPRTAA